MMNQFARLRRRTTFKNLGKNDGAQIVELAVTLPLLVVILIGIYDFGQAYNLKQKLAGAAREGARFASNQSSGDLTNSGTNCSPAPDSICAVRDVVDSYLIANNVNDCGLKTNTTTITPLNLQWTFTATGCTAGNFTLVINRGAIFTTTPGGTGTPLIVEGSQVSLSYPYVWQFNRVVQLIAPGSAYGPAQIPVSAVMQNIN